MDIPLSSDLVVEMKGFEPSTPALRTHFRGQQYQLLVANPYKCQPLSSRLVTFRDTSFRNLLANVS
ncbi:hypothetical protein Desti_2286 [Desulfomonile tiedjei DSM 6799]|uniref:Uncharacterized protein n=1 Tax=Desulfomonile tiedjei (strain ATCC 49306 / DSM 6799 / DCB-1) TaxID=706587 RepID=I4C5Y5_DESTA|nr:hypothetical protein Desti_2286 [Desulfomonile tiedjei DSM 6799]